VTEQLPDGVSARIVELARTTGVSSAGITSVSDLLQSPSHLSRETTEWSERGRSVVVVSLAHEEARPELDWWGVEGGTAGNHRLQAILKDLEARLHTHYGLESWPLPYSPAAYLKDAAVLAGMGAIGDNNLLITPEYGPRVRLRALLVDGELTLTGPVAYTPCDSCDHPCWEACPQRAFASGRYARERCQLQMEEDDRNRVEKESTSPGGTPISLIKYCRACELACPVGQGCDV
jgi:epoxyqueuosine reductase